MTTDRPSRPSVLVVEDYPTCQLVTRALLEKSGYVVSIVGDGAEALAILAEHPFDVVLMDVQLPTLDGLEATRRLRVREDGTDRRTPVIGITAHALPGDEERCLAAGMDAYLAKPYRLTQLLDLVETAVLPSEPGDSAVRKS